MSKRNLAIIAATVVAIIFGITFTVAKDVMPTYIKPFGFIAVRVGIATVLFWLVGLFVSREKIARSDFPRIIAAAFFGVAFNMLTFFEGLSQTSPIMASVLMVTTPIIVLVLSAIIMKERILRKKAIGIVLGLVGTVLLILYGKSVTSEGNALWGNFLVFINAVSYGLYLITVKKLMDKYNAFSLVKWIYLFGFIMVLPFGWQQLSEVNWAVMPQDIYWAVGFVVVCTTFFAYLLNLLAMKQLKPTTVAVFIYLQPFFATLFAIGVGKDELDVVKVLSALLIFVGVYLVTRPVKKVV
ncbi:DMT family transporter [Flavobacterium arcticum]|uniref:DMT family transporter n=1 Tax=Flavobacterium arcticum TaxID=1784713 RepID=A0A345HBF6_9FLAO|nr:DMT family transporter [Flavobacterium arcticum]AXG73916.1 DMT family transporter [Flavobacterium arcticum]KAF2508893.1 DMT family transporter [Flavobacterium arcticum]